MRLPERSNPIANLLAYESAPKRECGGTSLLRLLQKNQMKAGRPLVGGSICMEIRERFQKLWSWLRARAVSYQGGLSSGVSPWY